MRVRSCLGRSSILGAFPGLRLDAWIWERIWERIRKQRYGKRKTPAGGCPAGVGGALWGSVQQGLDLMPIVPRWAFPFMFFGLLGSKDCLNQIFVDRVHWVAIPFRVLVNQFVIFRVVHRSISLFPCAIGVANPVFDLVLDEVPYARTAIAVNAFAVNSLIGFIVCPLGQKDNAETISAVLDDIVVAGAVVGVVHGFDSSWAFSVIGSHRCWCGCQIIRPTLTYSVLAPIFFVAIKKYY